MRDGMAEVEAETGMDPQAQADAIAEMAIPAEAFAKVADNAGMTVEEARAKVAAVVMKMRTADGHLKSVRVQEAA